MLHSEIDIGSGRTLHVVNLHMKLNIANDIAGQNIDNYTWRSASAWAADSLVSSLFDL